MEGNLCRGGVGADPRGVKCSHSEEHSCYHHPATSLSSLHLGSSTNTVLALLS